MTSSRLLTSLKVEDSGFASVTHQRGRVLLTGSLYRVGQDPVGSVVLGVIDETVFNESQINSFREE